MNNAERLGMPSAEQTLSHALQLYEAVQSLLLDATTDENEARIDLIGLAFVLKEGLRLHGIIRLIEDRDFFNASALLRGLWESRIIWTYLNECVDDPEKAAEGYGAFMDFKWAEKARKSTTAEVSRTPDIVSKCDDYNTAFESLPENIRAICRLTAASLYDVCVKLDVDAPMDIPEDMDAWSYKHEYDAVFRQCSDAVHGGLQGVQSLVDVLINGLEYPRDRVDDLTRGLLGQACSYLREILQTWSKHTHSEVFRRLIAPALAVGTKVE
jgi:hypothetical protein